MSAAAFAPKGELVLTRNFNAPRELVFKVWTDPKHVAQWWGPHGFTTRILEMDVRPGGVWRYAMRGQDGNDYPFDGARADDPPGSPARTEPPDAFVEESGEGLLAFMR